ncbi:MAG: hypothetical protein K0S32_2656 [Bacteroidetes bacterium]|jgi:hypothetical protein|nr:hypothetical protein [Bacteroidota bacterium]
MKNIICLLTVTIAFCSCSHRSYAPAYGGGGSYKVRKINPSTGWSEGNNGGFESKKENIKQEERVVIYNGSMTLVVKNADSVNAHLSRVAAKYEGYILTIGTESSTIRVKAIYLDKAMGEIYPIGKLKRKSVYGEDVTEEYYDSKIRLDNCNKARVRYLELLAKAENVEAALKVEKELERLNREIDVLEGKIKRLAHLSEYSTITIHMEKKVKPGILGYVFVGLYKGVKWLFVRG